MDCSLHVEKDTRSFSHTFSEDPGPLVLKVKLALRDWLGSNDMSGQVLLEGITVPKLDICRMQTLHVISFGRHFGNAKATFRLRTKRRTKKDDSTSDRCTTSLPGKSRRNRKSGKASFLSSGYRRSTLQNVKPNVRKATEFARIQRPERPKEDASSGFPLFHVN
jgi:hypothetical protein